ncbi:MAG: nucleotidyl transferase AbiEii/AbiGii toxin family protein [Patescibacteria group bacterium]
MAYYHEVVTQKSWEELQKLKETIDFTLIGGWAAYFYTKALKSKDIDILVNFDQLPKLQKEYALSKNERLKKYEAIKGEVQIDTYLPHFSQIGIPVENLMENTKTVEGFNTLDINYLVALKIYTLNQRGHSPKGRKDLFDILSLVQKETFSYKISNDILKKYEFKKELENLRNILSESNQIPELNLNTHKFSKLKKEMLTKFVVS